MSVGSGSMHDPEPGPLWTWDAQQINIYILCRPKDRHVTTQKKYKEKRCWETRKFRATSAPPPRYSALNLREFFQNTCRKTIHLRKPHDRQVPVASSFRFLAAGGLLCKSAAGSSVLHAGGDDHTPRSREF